jgi:hypothetical protein
MDGVGISEAAKNEQNDHGTISAAVGISAVAIADSDNTMSHSRKICFCMLGKWEDASSHALRIWDSC